MNELLATCGLVTIVCDKVEAATELERKSELADVLVKYARKLASQVEEIAGENGTRRVG
jgi:hypothetical protein